jgi:DNA-binding NtrC family response regulator
LGHMPRQQSSIPKAPRTLAGIMSDYERVIIIQALQLNGFCRARAATSLGLSRSGLWRRMRMLRIDLAALPKAAPGPHKDARPAALAGSRPIFQGQGP